MTTGQKRIGFAALFLGLTLIEVLIALFVHDTFIRPYVGDMLVVMVLYGFVRIFIPDDAHWLPAALFLFAAGIETLQYFDFVSHLGPLNTRFTRILLGGTFDVKDLLCYAAGCAVLGGVEWLRWRRSKRG